MTATIRMTRRQSESNPWLAEVVEIPEMFAVGATQYEALGRLVTAHWKYLEVDLEWPPEHERKWPDDMAVNDADGVIGAPQDRDPEPDVEKKED